MDRGHSVQNELHSGGFINTPYSSDPQTTALQLLRNYTCHEAL